MEFILVLEPLVNCQLFRKLLSEHKLIAYPFSKWKVNFDSKFVTAIFKRCLVERTVKKTTISLRKCGAQLYLYRVLIIRSRMSDVYYICSCPQHYIIFLFNILMWFYVFETYFFCCFLFLCTLQVNTILCMNTPLLIKFSLKEWLLLLQYKITNGLVLIWYQLRL